MIPIEWLKDDDLTADPCLDDRNTNSLAHFWIVHKRPLRRLNLGNENSI